MPSTSDKQRRFMAAAAHNPSFAKEAGIKQSVAKEFNSADKAKAGDHAAMRKPFGNPKGHTAGKAGAATYKPERPNEREQAVGKKGLTRGS